MAHKAKNSKGLHRAERWAIGVTVLILTLTLGYHLGTDRRAPELRVRTETRMPDPVTEREAAEGTEISGSAGRIDLNRATSEELQALRGVGPVLAERIVAYRTEHGPFEKLEDLTRVNGIGPSVLEENEDRLYVGEAGP